MVKSDMTLEAPVGAKIASNPNRWIWLAVAIAMLAMAVGLRAQFSEVGEAPSRLGVDSADVGHLNRAADFVASATAAAGAGLLGQGVVDSADVGHLNRAAGFVAGK